VHHDQEGPSFSAEQSQESFLGSFDRVPSGLDPTQVYSYFIRMSARIRQLEEQTKQVSAPFLLEAALRESTEIRTQSAQAAERTYNEVGRAAQEEAARIKREAEQQANEAMQTARASLGDVQRQADELINQARQEAEQVRREADTFNEQAEQELERLCVDFANFLQRMLDRRNAGRGTGGAAGGSPAESAVASFAQESAASGEPEAAPPASTPPQAWSQPAATNHVSGSLPTWEQPGPAAERPAAGSAERPNGTPGWSASAAPTGTGERSPAPPPPPLSPAVQDATAAPPPRSEEQGTEQRQQDQDKPGQEQKGFRLPSWLDM
jgi:F0F1-type ATP synthase membrane subunit b/b'